MALVKSLVLAILCMVGVAIAATQEELLRAAIVNPKITDFTLTKDLVLTRDLPRLPANKVFRLRGSPGPKLVKIDGQGRYRFFSNAEDTVVTLSLSDLYFTRSKEAVVDLQTLGTKLKVARVTFEKLPRALRLDLVTATITDSKFLANTNSSVRLSSQEGEVDKVTFKNCEFKGNRGEPTIGGGAIYASLYSTVVIERSTFSNNYADYYGGAVRFRNAYGTIRYSNFLNNVAKEQAGAASVYKGSLTIVGSTFQGNKAQTGSGGALRVGSDGDESSSASITSSKFIGNSAPNGYGGVFVLDTGVSIQFCRSNTFSGNKGKGGIISNGFVISTGNTISTTPKITIPEIKLDAGAAVTYKSGEKCRF